MRLLRRVEICGQEWKVYSTSKDNPALEGNSGVCDSIRAEIHVADDGADTVQIDTFLHEILHAILAGTGQHARLEAASKKLGPSSALEEEIVSAVTPALRAALKSAGWREPKRIGKAPRARRPR